MLILDGAALSRAHRVSRMIKQLAIPFQHVATNFLDGSTRQPDFLRINPNGRVPVIDDNGFILCESLAINLYLAKKHRRDLSPATPTEEAAATQWSFWVATEVEKPLLLAAANAFLFEETVRSEAVRKRRPWPC